MNTRFNGLKKYIDKRIMPFHDYLTGRQAIEKYRKPEDIKISKEVWGLIKWLIIIILALVGVKQGLN